MQIILTPQQMRELEQQYFRRTGTPSADLMGTAATKLVQAMDELGLVRGKDLVFLCGAGGNGGDGLAAARICDSMGARCRVVLAQSAERYTGDAALYLHRLPESVRICGLDEIREPDLWVDALFGIGLSRDVGGFYAECIARMNASAAPVVSVDIPSGIDGRTGDIRGCAVMSDWTITFQHPKPGHFLRHGMDHSGQLIVRSIGIPEEFLCHVPPVDTTHPFILRPEDVDIAAMLPPRRHFSHKNSHGHLLLIAGSRGMAGAAAIAARAALHSGVGLLTIACPQEIVPILQNLVPEAMCLPLPQDKNGCIAKSALNCLTDAFAGKKAIAIGPGLSRGIPQCILDAVAESGIPAVFDADALNLRTYRPHHLITPHPGEAARLIQPSGNEIADTVALHNLGAQVIYKGASSIIAAKNMLYLSDTGSPCMAKGGSGDCLTGIAGALLARGMTAECAAIAASHIHGRAGEWAEQKFGLNYPTAMDVIACLPAVWQALGQ